ncbi:hypothetical protein [uncultured Thiocystis sp.]|jgi:hypothetical protein|uniref:hypothetical protein n=1 Tax=uncultured Thiocystis sp. TaxID=1202134 RepID=UPI0025D3B426|nr:hypothetical protein [uncultured Thiocystis sp.]
MSDYNKLLSKRDLSKHFGVSQTTVNNWLDRGMPAAKKPDGSFGDHYLFDLPAVAAWRAKMAAAGRIQGGRPTEKLPPALEQNPHWQNGCRFLAEQSVRDFIHHWQHADDAAGMTVGVLVDLCDGDEPRAMAAFSMVYLSLFHAFTGWLVEDDLDAFLVAHGHGGIDGLWCKFTGNVIETHTPYGPRQYSAAGSRLPRCGATGSISKYAQISSLHK